MTVETSDFAWYIKGYIPVPVHLIQDYTESFGHYICDPGMSVFGLN